MAPAQYGRVFTVVKAVFPDGIASDTSDGDWRTLRELLGPIICRTFAEQERFGDVFDSVMTKHLVDDGGSKTDDDETSDRDTEVETHIQSRGRFWLIKVLMALGLAVTLLVFLYNKLTQDNQPQALDCTADFGIQSSRDKIVTFINRSPGVARGQTYEWDFGDGTPPLSTSLITVSHQFRDDINPTLEKRVTLRAVGCSDPLLNKSDSTETNNFNPSPLPFLRLPETTRYTLANWVPLLLMGLGGLLGWSWWLTRRRRQRAQAPQRPTGGPFFLSFPQQDDAIQPSPSLLSWAHQLQQREESERHMLAIGPTIRRTIRNGGMPSVQYEAIKRRPRYLILIDDRSAYDQQAKLYAYVMGVLITRSVEMDVFFFHSDPRYLWNENHPKGLPISDLLRLYSSHYLVLVTEGTRLLDYNTGEVAAWAVEALSGWMSRALLTPVYPANWHYLEAALSRFFILLPATPDGQLLLRDYLGQPDNVPSFEELLRQFKVMPGTPSRGIFSPNTAKMTVEEVRNFLNTSTQGADQNASVREWLFTWACATAVFPTPDWAMTLAIGRALEANFRVDGLVTSTNILKLTALPWLRQDSIPEPLRANLLAQLPHEVATVARQTVVAMLNDLQLSPGSVAYEEQQLRLWEQEYHLQTKGLSDFSGYRQHPDLFKDEAIQHGLARQDRIENKYQPAGLLALLILPLLLYMTPPQTQVASVLLPFFRADSTALDSAAFYNNRALTRLEEKRGSSTESSSRLKTVLGRLVDYTDNTSSKWESYGAGTLDLIRSVEYRPTFEGVHNMNTARYNLAVERFGNSYSKDETIRRVQQLLSPSGEVPQLMKPFGLFDADWVPDSAVTRQYLALLANKAANNTIYTYIDQANLTSINSGSNQEVGISRPIDQAEFNQLADKARSLFSSPGTMEIAQNPQLNQRDASKLREGLRGFKPTTAQRDSLISIEAARIVLYFGGPQRAKKVPLEAPNNITRGTTEPMNYNNASSGSTGGGWEEPVRKPRPSNQTAAKPRISARATAAQQSTVRRLPYRLPSTSLPPDTVSVRQQPVSSTIPPSQTAPDIVSTPPPTRTVAQANLPATVGNDDNTANQQVQQQQVQQNAPAIDETNLERMYQETVKCTGKSALSFALPKRDRQSIRLFEVVKLGDNANLYELTVYCDSQPQTLYSKQGFNYVKVFVSRNNSVIWSFLRDSPKAK